MPTDQSRPTLEYTYDATQQRLSKKVTDADGSITATYYAYDAMGVPMATYTHQETGQASTLTLNDFMLYGSGRLGSYQVNEPAGGTAPVPLLAANLRFELTDHLGTVRAVVTGQKTGTGKAEIVSLTDYYPYGMDMPGRSFQSEAYRYGYQGSERDPEMSGGAGYTTFFRALDPRIGRWLTPDPKVFPWQSPYVSMDGNPVGLVDPRGANTEGNGPDAIVGENKDGFTNLISEVDVLAPAGAYTNQLLLSGDANRPERFPASIPRADYSSPKWVSALKGIAFLMEVAIPGAGHVKSLNEIADNGGKISSCPSMAEDGLRDILEKELDKRYIPVEGKSFTASNMGNVKYKKALSLGKGGAKLSATNGVDLVNVLAGMIVDDLVSEIEELNVARQIAKIIAISDYDKFIDAAREYNSDPNTIDPIIILYSNSPIVSGPGETFSQSGLTPSTDIGPSASSFGIRDEYNGFVPQYVSWGFKSGYSGNSILIIKTIKINYDGVQIKDNRGY